MVNQIKKAKPTSAGRRFRSWVSREGLHSGSPYAPLLEKKKQRSGRNNQGKIIRQRYPLILNYSLAQYLLKRNFLAIMNL